MFPEMALELYFAPSMIQNSTKELLNPAKKADFSKNQCGMNDDSCSTTTIVPWRCSSHANAFRIITA
jgi:hypothetical protein